MSATPGGQRPDPKPIDYKPPQGPKGIDQPAKPGLGGTNHGTCGTQRS